MLSLQQMCLKSTAQYLESIRLIPLCDLPPNIKSQLLTAALLRGDKLTQQTLNAIFNAKYFDNLAFLDLPQNESLNDSLMTLIGSSSCKLHKITVTVCLPAATRAQKQPPLTVKGLSALFANQDELEEFSLTWCIGFQPGVLTRISSRKLRKVSIQADSICRCVSFDLLSRTVEHYQRDFSVLAINNPSISQLCLDGVVLDLEDCYTLFGALAGSLRQLEIRYLGCYSYCQRVHAFHGSRFVLFLQFLMQTCKGLQYLACTSSIDDRHKQQLVIESSELRHLDLDGHIFEMPLLLCCENLAKLKISLSGSETDDHFASIAQLPRLHSLHLSLVQPNKVQGTDTLRYMFAHLGSAIRSIRDITVNSVDQLAPMICEYATNLKRLNISHLQALSSQSDGSSLLPLFQNPTRATLLEHIQLGFGTVNHSVLHFLSVNCTRLKTIDMAYCSTIDDETLKLIAENCRETLTTVDISRCSQVTDKGVVALSLRSQHLQELNLFDVHITDCSILAMASNCRKLRVLGISATTLARISQTAITKLMQSCLYRIILGG